MIGIEFKRTRIKKVKEKYTIKNGKDEWIKLKENTYIPQKRKKNEKGVPYSRDYRGSAGSSDPLVIGILWEGSLNHEEFRHMCEWILGTKCLTCYVDEDMAIKTLPTGSSYILKDFDRRLKKLKKKKIVDRYYDSDFNILDDGNKRYLVFINEEKLKKKIKNEKNSAR